MRKLPSPTLGAPRASSATLTLPSLQVGGDVYLQYPRRVAEVVAVERYSERWPLTPTKELHASSAQYPQQAWWRWLLHIRRGPVMAENGWQESGAAGGTNGAAEPVGVAPRCASGGDSETASWVCWERCADVGGARPRMPWYALANDDWLGRGREEVREASEATRWLSCLGLVCWQQLRLGSGAPDLQEKGITGHTILVAQELLTLKSETLDLPTDKDAPVDGVNKSFAGRTGKRAKVGWYAGDPSGVVLASAAEPGVVPASAAGPRGEDASAQEPRVDTWPAEVPKEEP